jgi:hypothetical protein
MKACFDREVESIAKFRNNVLFGKMRNGLVLDQGKITTSIEDNKPLMMF